MDEWHSSGLNTETDKVLSEITGLLAEGQKIKFYTRANFQALTLTLSQREMSSSSSDGVRRFCDSLHLKHSRVHNRRARVNSDVMTHS
jgi:hypothetical protein